MASVLTVAATGMLISLGVALFVFRPAWSDLAFIALMVKDKSEDASDLV